MSAISPEEVKAVVAAEVEKALAAGGAAACDRCRKKPFVILVAGVNGSGKTTTIGKLAAKLRAEGRSVMLAAGDTFRAAAIDAAQNLGGAQRRGLHRARSRRRCRRPRLRRGRDGQRARHRRSADRYRRPLAEPHRIDGANWKKSSASSRKSMPTAPHAVLLVLDATVGQNALSQVEIFKKAVGVTGLAMTKLDGTARGGILVAIAAKFAVPVHFIGVGESVDDLSPFSARDFARAIVGLDSAGLDS